MELKNEFVINKPVEAAWPILTDLERIAPCMPGAQLTEIEGDIYRGLVKIKVGPIGANFNGQATFVTKDDTNHTAQLKADGRDTKGNGNASALISAALTPIDTNTCRCTVDTDLNITGKVAQFGRGVLPEISKNLINQFADNLNEMITNDPGTTTTATTADAEAADSADSAEEPSAEATDTTADTSTAADAPKVRKINSAPVEPLQATSLVPSWAKIAVPAALLSLLAFFFFGRRRR